MSRSVDHSQEGSHSEAHEGAGERPPVRVVTAASLFDGHDAAINIMRRLLQARGAEVIHLGHDRAVEELVEAAVEEGADAVAVSSYQGGHVEYFEYLVRRLVEEGVGHVRVYGGGGGTITPAEIEHLHRAGVARIFSPDDGRRLGLAGMIGAIVDECLEARRAQDADPATGLDEIAGRIEHASARDVARLIGFFESHAERRKDDAARLRERLAQREGPVAPVVGFTGTGGAGKSSVVDELVMRLRRDAPDLRIALLLVDPTRRRSGGALLGDRIRMNAIAGPQVYVRSMATRRAHLSLSAAVGDALGVLRRAGFDLVFLETAGIGQSDSEIVDQVDCSLYVMTPDYGAPSQLEKIDMIDYADLIVLNKCDRRGAADALRDIRKQWRRNRGMPAVEDSGVPVFPTVARCWNDPGMEQLARALEERLGGLGLDRHFPGGGEQQARIPGIPEAPSLVPASRQRYLAEIAETLRAHRARVEESARAASRADGFARVLATTGRRPERPLGAIGRVDTAAGDGRTQETGFDGAALAVLERGYARAVSEVEEELARCLEAWPETRAAYEAPRQSYGVRERSIEVGNRVESLSGTMIPKVALPRTNDWGDLVRYLGLENLPGRFPFTAGVFPFKRQEEDPTRMFAGEGGPERTNRRFHYLSAGQPAARLSTAFDSVTLYGRDPAVAPDVFGKVGNSGVSICTLDDAKKLYSGFDLSAPSTSVSLTINGPAPTVLAFFLNAAIDQRIERHLRERGELEAVRARFEAELAEKGLALPRYEGDRPPGHDGLGLGLLGIPGDRAVDAETYARLRSEVLGRVRGTVQADILKEDQAQNTCIFSTDFSLALQGDIQETFCREGVRNFYSISISGYHMAEAGANPITQLAFTLANGFTFCEYFAARGMAVDDFAANFSFFFSNGLDAEYSVLGRVARRIWAVAMRDRYGANERSQKLKYHIQTSGRSLHAQEMDFNDIRTTLQALTALQDQCNSLHTNAYDEAVTTPTVESVRRALAIQLIINREAGLMKNENPIQGAYVIEALTDLVEEAVLAEFERLSDRGGVLGAMETLYQRGRIQDESMLYEQRKHSGELPIIGVNTFLAEDAAAPVLGEDRLMRSSEGEKRAQLDALAAFHARWAEEAPRALAELQAAARRGENLFDRLLETVKVASLGQISEALFEVGGRYRRAM
ncbi:MAG: cobalamin B12-binding domain-containing protein [Spirochaetaceae bacterium]|nr:cobalamin B12-binding domain-containing protein [Spirochaetaceae bacterium]